MKYFSMAMIALVIGGFINGNWGVIDVIPELVAYILIMMGCKETASESSYFQQGINQSYTLIGLAVALTIGALFDFGGVLGLLFAIIALVTLVMHLSLMKKLVLGMCEVQHNFGEDLGGNKLSIAYKIMVIGYIAIGINMILLPLTTLMRASLLIMISLFLAGLSAIVVVITNIVFAVLMFNASNKHMR